MSPMIPWYNPGIAIRKDIWQGTTCRRCGLTFEALCDEGLLGCAHCYATFRGLIEAAIPELHGVVVPAAWATQRAIPLPSPPEKETAEALESAPTIVSPFNRLNRRQPVSPERTRSG